MMRSNGAWGGHPSQPSPMMVVTLAIFSLASRASAAFWSSRQR